MPTIHPAIRTTLLCTALLFLLSACGQKGPLFLPPGGNEEATQAQASNPADNAAETAQTSESGTSSEPPSN